MGSADADDMVQEVLLKLQVADRSDHIGNPESYLFQVARNMLISRYRSERLRDGINMPCGDAVADARDELSPERILIARDEYARVQRAILTLPARARAAFHFHRFENMTYPEIAKVMGISKDRVKQLMRRALEGIAEEDIDGGYDLDPR